jgi:tRNA G10  N-methylase Trm11
MVNVAREVKKSAGLRLLDPLAGRGTVLFEGIAQDMDVIGIEIDKSAEEANVFFQKFLEEGRYKHKFSREKRTDTKGRRTAAVCHAEFAHTKELFNDKTRKHYSLYIGDANECLGYLKKGSVDMVVADLPYGVQHTTPSKSRNAVFLVRQLAEGLNTVLAKGGSVVFAFNEFTTKKEELARILQETGFEVLDEYPFDDFTHRVDQAIKRNLIIARKPAYN